MRWRTDRGLLIARDTSANLVDKSRNVTRPSQVVACAWPRVLLARAARAQAARARRPRGPIVPLFGGDFLLRPPPADAAACSVHSCAPHVWTSAGIIFCSAAAASRWTRRVYFGLQVRPRPPAAAVRPRKSGPLTPRQLVRARQDRLHLWAPRQSTSTAQMELVGVWAVGAAGGGCDGAVGGHRQPIPHRAREICAQNRPRRRAASARGASGA